jgi:hypothetical protein
MTILFLSTLLHYYLYKYRYLYLSLIWLALIKVIKLTRSDGQGMWQVWLGEERHTDFRL